MNDESAEGLARAPHITSQAASSSSSTVAASDRESSPERRTQDRSKQASRRHAEASEEASEEEGGGKPDDDEEAKRDKDGVRMEDGVPMVGLTGLDDPFSPLRTSNARKWVILLVVSSAAFCVTCCSSMVSLTYDGTAREFGETSLVIMTLGISLFVLGLGIIPLLLGPLSEYIGRRPIYFVSYGVFIAFNFQVAFAHNLATWLIGRFFCGMFASPFLSVAGGTVTDLWAPDQVASPMAFYTASPFLGPVIGPIISGVINQHLDWRWTWYILIMWSAVEFAALFLLVPETYLPALLKKKAKHLRQKGCSDVRAPIELDERTPLQVVAASCLRPLQILIYESMALVLCTWTALLLGILYMAFSAWPIVYRDQHGFSTQETGFSFTGIGVGIVIGTFMQPVWAIYYGRITKETGERPPPEEHLRKGCWGAVLVPVSLFWFAFTSYASIHWAVSQVSTIFFGIGIILSYQAVFVYLVDAFRPVAASAMAANSAMRSSFACVFPLFTQAMFKKLGTAGTLALIAGLTCCILPFPFLFFKYGHK
ncbi:BQ5605_C002g01269 [Microbotryum silenes-dioicae]|uniref:BQ5605_C002g01269 protein n=1 Tax=Microbotryum silenes-dioicae TaxID=796604 RepID=A0A2X0P1G0_9BASI|nr:BQ5605_C002g01269 [Microbotryum silenes-dioicae]